MTNFTIIDKIRKSDKFKAFAIVSTSIINIILPIFIGVANNAFLSITQALLCSFLVSWLIGESVKDRVIKGLLIIALTILWMFILWLLILLLIELLTGMSQSDIY